MNALARLVLTVLLGSNVVAGASDADLDTTFSYDGYDILCNSCPAGPPPPSHDDLTNLFPLANGNYVMVGSVDYGGINGPLVAFSTVTPTQHTTVITAVPGVPTAAAQDQAGRFVVAVGSTVMRFSSNFALDTTFGSGGSLVVTFPGYTNPDAGLQAIAIDHAQRVVVAGFAIGSGSNGDDMAVLRLTGSGAYDDTFGSAGRQMIGFDLDTGQFPVNDDRAYSIDVAPDDGLLIAGMAHNVDARGGFDELALARLQSSGALDPSFNSTGKRAFDLGGTGDFVPFARFDHAGRILVAARDRMLRLLASGQDDAAFLGSDPLSTPGTAPVALALSMFAERSDGRLVLAGTTWDSNSQTVNVSLARLMPSGADDDTFNSGSNTTVLSLGAITYPSAIAIDAGRAVIGVEWYASGFDIYRWCIARLQSDLVFKNRFGD
jgi:uncharacterized delta-60 repeat protein